jgi:hypothetical protein
MNCLALFTQTEEETEIGRSNYLFLIGRFNHSTNYITNQMTSTCIKCVLYRFESVHVEGTVTKFHLANTLPQQSRQ